MIDRITQIHSYKNEHVKYDIVTVLLISISVRDRAILIGWLGQVQKPMGQPFFTFGYPWNLSFFRPFYPWHIEFFRKKSREANLVRCKLKSKNCIVLLCTFTTCTFKTHDHVQNVLQVLTRNLFKLSKDVTTFNLNYLNI